MRQPESTHTGAGPFEREKARIVNMLAAEAATAQLQLPGFPRAAADLQQLLNDAHAEAEQLVQVITAEPALATQILRLANSPLFNPGSQPVRDLTAAVQCLDASLLRAALLAFVVRQLRQADERSALSERCSALWRRSVAVGAIARAIATQQRLVSADVALLAGLLHAIGNLHVLLQLNRTAWLLEQAGFAESVMEQCGDTLGSTLIASWGVPGLPQALLDYASPQRALAGPPDLADLLAAAVRLADLLPSSRTEYLDQIQLAHVFAQAEPLWLRLGLTRTGCSDVLHKALEDLQSLRAIFGA